MKVFMKQTHALHPTPYLLWLLILLAACQQTPAAATPTAVSDPTAATAATSQPTLAAVPTIVAEVETAVSAPSAATAAATAATPTAVSASSEPAPTASLADLPPRPGALIALSLESRAGYLLNDIPPDQRDRVAADLIAQPAENWLARAEMQFSLTQRRLTFRNFVYPGKGQLPLPPREQWHIELVGEPSRQTVQNHDLVTIGYRFSGTLLTAAEEPARAEPALDPIGGTWTEPFVLPLDPTLLLQRTGNACVNEAGFPPNSFDSENISIFYDHGCTADSGGPAGCHRTQLPTLSCLEAVDATIGRWETAVTFTRLPWDDALADAVRFGPVTSADTPDLQVRTGDLNENRIIYRYFPSNSCALQEACVSGSGWRRLLQFSATVHNLGGQPLDIGPVVSEDPLTNLFSYNSCHDHFHFSNYGAFIFGSTDQASKQAFCVESTGRFSNNEYTPLTHAYSCSNQGIQAGWVDEYNAGLDCQWIDITDMAELTDSSEPVSLPLTFTSNTDQFLCEGSPVLDDSGNRVWALSGLSTASGLPISYPQCDFIANWDSNNSGTVEVAIPPSGGFMTEPCENGELGSRRNCGFTKLDDGGKCEVGTAVQLTCSLPTDAAPQVVRVCETSAALGTGLDCMEQDALANITLTATSQLSFTCPLPRDENEPGGGYALYTAPVYPGDAATPVVCTAP